MRTEYLESFLAVSKYKSLSKAAQLLFITQPTLSNRISSLETILDVKLFERSWNGVQLTSDGILFLDYCIQIFNKLDDFNALSNNYKEIMDESYTESIDEIFNTFKIGMNNYLVEKYGPIVINTINEHFPNLKFNIVTKSTTELKILFKNDVIDYIIYYDFKPSFNNTEEICNDTFKILVSKKDFQLIEKRPSYIETIEKTIYLNSNPVLDTHVPYYIKFRERYKHFNFKIITNLNLIKLLVKEGKGYSILPELVCDSLSYLDPYLYKLDLPEFLPKLSIYTTYRETNEENNFIKQALVLNQMLKLNDKVYL